VIRSPLVSRIRAELSFTGTSWSQLELAVSVYQVRHCSLG
jgi:hypothetical protein